MTRAWSGRWERRAIAMVVGLVVASGCSDDSPLLVEPVPRFDDTGIPGGTPNGWDLPLLGAGQLARAFPGSPCADPPHREFDFWVGEWNVTNLNGVQIGTNIVTSDLDGCLVEEHWTASNGSRGRSLNTYDRETGLWNQTWVSQGPASIFGRLRTSGGIVDGAMNLTGVRNTTAGFTFLDTWNWSENTQGQVTQSASLFVPELNLTFPFTGIYTRGDVTPAPPLFNAICQEGGLAAETRDADFLIGSWDVSAENGPPIGTSAIETDLNDCVFVEHFESVGGLSAISYVYVDLWVERWFQTYVDSEGERLELEGGFENGALVLRATEAHASGPVDVTVTWEPDGGSVRQVWEVSQNGGATWERTVTLVYTAQ